MAEFQDIRILIPGYSIEDLPTDLDDREASSLLNAFAVAWHPKLLVRSAALPDVYQAEATELPTGQHFLLIPECSESWLGADWKLELEETESVVFYGSHERSEWAQQIHEAIQTASDGDDQPLDQDLLADFFAFGIAWLQVRLMSRRMHFFVDPDQNRLDESVLAAASDAIAGNIDSARKHLTTAAECLLDCREQFYPVDCYLLDLCLPADGASANDLTATLSSNDKLNVLASGQTLQTLVEHDGQLPAAISEAVVAGRLSLLSGHFHELRTTLCSLSGFVSDINQGIDTLKSLSTEVPLHWARQRFGLSSSLPSILGGLGFQSALHAALDDGVYPDKEDAQFDWKGIDGTTLFASSRLPMAIDTAASFQKFADRYSESMQEDTTAVILLARLPQLKEPWLDDLKRISRYAPVFGQFVSWDEYRKEVSYHDQPKSFAAGEYLSPSLIQSTVLKTESPVSSPTALLQTRTLLDAVQFAACQLRLLGEESLLSAHQPESDSSTHSGTTPPLVQQIKNIEQELNAEEGRRLKLSNSDDDTTQQAARLEAIRSRILDLQSILLKKYAARLKPEASTVHGRLLVNPTATGLETTVDWPAEWKLPADSDSVLSAWKHKKQTFLNVKLPPGGFAWIGEASGLPAVTAQGAKGKALAEPWLLRNHFFEVHLSEKTGGIAGVYFHRQRTNRISQQLAVRQERPRGYSPNRTDADDYRAARCTGATLLASGPWLGCIETEGVIRLPGDGQQEVRFRQKISVERMRPAIDIEIKIDHCSVPLEGNPWMTYLASRFAWDNPAAEVTRSQLGWPARTKMERFEAPHYVDISDSDHRVHILTAGQPFHVLSGGRMVDSLLMVEGETATDFRFRLVFDEDRPFAAATDFLQPPLSIDVTGKPNTSASAGWLLGLTAKNVVIARSEVLDSGALRLLLQETAGRAAKCRLRLARNASVAKTVLADGSTVEELGKDSDDFSIPFQRFQVKLIEVEF